MRIGKLRHWVEVHAPTTSQTLGDATRSWSVVGFRWANIEPLTGRELMQAQQAGSEVNVRITIRYLAGVTAEYRIVDGGVVYEVNAVIDTAMRHEELILMCKRLGV